MIKSVLLDQRVIASLGNIYSDEALFSAGIHLAREPPVRSRRKKSPGWFRRFKRFYATAFNITAPASIGCIAAALFSIISRFTAAPESPVSSAGRRSKKRRSAGGAPIFARAASRERGKINPAASPIFQGFPAVSRSENSSWSGWQKREKSGGSPVYFLNQTFATRNGMRRRCPRAASRRP